MISQDLTKELAISEAVRTYPPRKVWIAFVLVGFAIYLAVYAAAEMIVHQHGQKSRLFMIATAPKPAYDFVILGASHAMPLGYDDMNERLEQATGTSIINLSIEGGGIVPARFNLDYFLAEHTAKNVVYVLDSFVFYSRQWNEDRINDPKLLKRAPLDPALVSTLLKYPSARDLIPGYVSGFYKINDADRFKQDLSDNEGAAFDKVYKANAAIDRQRLNYLFPKEVDQTLLNGYLAQFNEFAVSLKARGINLILVRTPLPARVLTRVKGETEFNARIQEIVDAHGFALHDFSAVSNDDAFYYDTDHLNRAGTTQFIENHFAEVLRNAPR